eukprot:153292-Hanusia_phi.AAC.3
MEVVRGSRKKEVRGPQAWPDSVCCLMLSSPMPAKMQRLANMSKHWEVWWKNTAGLAERILRRACGG